MADLPKIPRGPLHQAVTAYETSRANGDSSTTAMRFALEAALPHLICSCPVISDVDDYCPQHGRDA